MPFKSKAQRRKFAQLLVEGKISDETYEEWNRSTGRTELPERLGAAAKAPTRASAGRPTRKPRTTTKTAARKRTPARKTPTTTKKRSARKKTAAKRPSKRAAPK